MSLYQRYIYVALKIAKNMGMRDIVCVCQWELKMNNRQSQIMVNKHIFMMMMIVIIIHTQFSSFPYFYYPFYICCSFFCYVLKKNLVANCCFLHFQFIVNCALEKGALHTLTYLNIHVHNVHRKYMFVHLLIQNIRRQYN